VYLVLGVRKEWKFLECCYSWWETVEMFKACCELCLVLGLLFFFFFPGRSGGNIISGYSQFLKAGVTRKRKPTFEV
jgi:hypothetical protein